MTPLTAITFYTIGEIESYRSDHNHKFTINTITVLVLSVGSHDIHAVLTKETEKTKLLLSKQK